MEKYDVVVNLLMDYFTEVEAENEQEALQIAKEELTFCLPEGTKILHIDAT